MPSHLLSASQIAAALDAGTITVAQAGILQIQRTGGNVLTDFVAPPIPSLPTQVDIPIPPTSNIFQPFPVLPIGPPDTAQLFQPGGINAGAVGTPIAFTKPPVINLPSNPIQPQGVPGMVSRFGLAAAPAIIIAFKTAAQLTNRGAAMRLGPLTGRGIFQSIIAGLGISQAVDIFSGFFGDSSKEQMLGELVEELIDSGYILWDTTDRRGNERTMEYVVIPVGSNSDREATYGMAYRPFSRSSMRKRDDAQDTYRRPTRARRRPQGGRGSRS